MTFIRGVVSVLVLSFAASVGAAEIEHAAAGCAPADRYLRISARAVPAGDVARAELQFRVDSAGAWYSAPMTAGSDGWTAFLPRPSAGLERFEYRIAATARDASVVTSGPHAVRIARGDESCAGGGHTAIDAPIVVTVPEGAPVTPPVPAGFSPAGVVAAEGPKPSRTGLKIAGGVAAVVVGGVTAAGIGEAASEEPIDRPSIPEVRFNTVSPTPGSVIDYRTINPLVVQLVMATEPAIPLSLTWQVDLISAAAGDCLFMAGVLSAVRRPLELNLTGPFLSRSVCFTSTYEAEALRIRLSYLNESVYDETVVLRYRIVR